MALTSRRQCTLVTRQKVCVAAHNDKLRRSFSSQTVLDHLHHRHELIYQSAAFRPHHQQALHTPMKCLQHLVSLLFVLAIANQIRAQAEVEQLQEAPTTEHAQLESINWKALAQDTKDIIKGTLAEMRDNMINVLNLRKPTPKTSFQWVLDPNASLPCTAEPGCYNSVTKGYNVLPMLNIKSDLLVVFQEAARPQNKAGLLQLNVKTQPGCFVSGCHLVPNFIFWKKEECYQILAERKPNLPDGSARIELGGLYYEGNPEGELYVRFESKNYLTEANTCTYDVVSGYKRWL